MTKKEKEEERLERIIRGLLKLPENRRCINCNILGPQYVCTTFWTFVCTNCSGVHREFTHRVKSVSMAKFNAEEISALQAGGNERARQIYFKEWDPRRNSFPDCRLRDFVKHVYVDRKFTGERSQERFSRPRLCEKQDPYDGRNAGAYVGGSRSPNCEDRHERNERSSGPPGGRNEERTLKYYFQDRSPRSVRESPRQGNSRRQTTRFEVVDDRFRDDDSQSGRVWDSHRFSPKESGQGSRSSDPQSNTEQPVSLAVRPLKQILGEKSIPLQVGEASKSTGGEAVNVSGDDKQSAPPSKEKPAASFPSEPRHQPESSFIDFSAEPNPTSGAAAAQQGNNPSSQLLTPPPPPPPRNTVEFLLFELSAPSVGPSGSNSQVPGNDNALVAAPVQNIPGSGSNVERKPPENMPTLPIGFGAQITSSRGSEQSNGLPLSVPPGQMLESTYSFDASGQATRTDNPSAQQLSLNLPTTEMSALADDSRAYATLHGENMVPRGASSAPDRQLVPDISSSASMSSTSMPAATPLNDSLLESFDSSSSFSTTKFPSEDPHGHLRAPSHAGSGSTYEFSGSQPSDFSAAHRIPEGQHDATRFGTQEKQPSNPLVDPNAQGISSAQAGQSSKEDSKADQDAAVRPQTENTGRKELPQDLFTGHFPASRPVPGWPTGPSYATGLGMQYHPAAMNGLACGSQPRSSNPFDFSNESAPSQPSQFPAMDNLHGALPDLTALGMALPTSGSNSFTSGLMRPQTASALLPQSTPFTSSFSSGAYTGQQPYMNMPHSRPLGPGGFAGDEAPPFSSFNISQQLNSGYSSQGPANGGNPFG